MKKTSKCKKLVSKATVLLATIVTLVPQVMTPMQAFAEETESSSVITSEGRQALDKITNELVIPLQEAIGSSATSDSSDATNDSTEQSKEQPEIATNSVVTDVVQNTMVERTGEQLAARVNPLDVQGLTDNEIISLANYLYGDYAKADASFTLQVQNDKGDILDIPFKRITVAVRSGGTLGETIPISWNVTKGAWNAWGDYTQIIHIDGNLAFCVQPATIFVPGEGFTSQTSLAGITPQEAFAINNIMNFGAKESDSNEFKVATTFLIWEALGWSVSSSLNYESFRNQVNQNISDFKKLPSFAQKNYTVKVGETLTLDDTNGVLGNYYVKTDGTNAEVKIDGNKLTVKPSVNSNDGSIDLYRNSHYSGSQYFWVNGNGSQAVTTGGATDPVATSITVKVIKNGNAEFTKLSDVSDLPLAGVTYKVKVGNEAEKEMKTGADGKLVFKEITHGTDIFVTEIANPEGYVLDSTTYKLTIEGGTTVSKKLTNKIQKGKFKGQKNKEVFKPDETWETGTPVYEIVPAAGIEFDVVAKTDITLPDKKTVVVEAGTIVDHVVTDDKGKFASTTELYIGRENVYQLKETNKPENYRDPSDIQTEFSIPYGNNTEALIFYDLGTIDNWLKTTDVIFNKKNALDLSNILNIAGATFLVEGVSPNVKHVNFTFTTETTGTAMKLLAGNGTATYKFTEVKRPDGFGPVTSDTDTRIVTVIDGQDMTIDWENMPLVPEEPKIGISTQAHTGDGKTQTFVWGEDVVFYDDVKITHQNIEAGTERAYETIQVAVYPDGTEKDVWTSGKVDYTVTDKETTERVLSEYDYKKDPEGTRYYFKEIGYSKPSDKEYEKDTEHNFDGKEKTQDITPIVKETPKTPATPQTPTTPQKTVGAFPQTGEQTGIAGILLGTLTIVSLLAYGFYNSRKKQA